MTFNVTDSGALPSVKKRAKLLRTIGKVVIYAVLVVYAVWVVFPFLVLVVTSLTPEVEMNATMQFIWFPKKIRDRKSVV